MVPVPHPPELEWLVGDGIPAWQIAQYILLHESWQDPAMAEAARAYVRAGLYR